MMIVFNILVVIMCIVWLIHFLNKKEIKWACFWSLLLGANLVLLIINVLEQIL